MKKYTAFLHVVKSDMELYELAYGRPVTMDCEAIEGTAANNPFNPEETNNPYSQACGNITGYWLRARSKSILRAVASFYALHGSCLLSAKSGTPMVMTPVLHI
jgi:hypothetical protein